MIPTPGQKVWIVNSGGDLPAGVYAAVALSPNPTFTEPGWWNIELVDIPNYANGQSAHQDRMCPRDDPPPQQEPIREQIGSWDGCVWKPAREVA